MNKAMKALIIFIAQGAYSGRSRIAPGTAGSLLGVLLYLAMKDLSPVAYILICFIIMQTGTWAAGHAEKLLGRKDDPSIVIDEVSGYLFSMFNVPFGWGYAVAGFFLFRAFDILKPFPLRRLQDIKGGPGVMLDDFGAAVYTNVALRIATVIAGKW